MRTGLDGLATWILLTSIGFYALVDPTFVPLLVASTVGNYYLGRALVMSLSADRGPSRSLLVAGLAANFAVLAFYKYGGFALGASTIPADTVGRQTPEHLPLGISFWTFAQVAYLVDLYVGRSQSSTLLHYSVFTVFFPKVVAGPIVRHQQFVPHLSKMADQAVVPSNVVEGTILIVLGLAKKVILADGLAPLADSVYLAAATRAPLTLVEAWTGVLAYTFQIYFDFSGYSDLAIGMALWFGIRLPLNFNSPYKATSIGEYWRRWHMTLSSFLRDYIYIPLGGNRQGRVRHYLNLIITMVLCGLWHGASQTFLVWGGLHGVFLSINHAWKKSRLNCPTPLAWGITFLAVCESRAWFRADSLGTGWYLSKTMWGSNGLVPSRSALQLMLDTLWTPVPEYQFVAQAYSTVAETLGAGRFLLLPVELLLSPTGRNLLVMGLSILVVFGLPNSNQLAQWMLSQRSRAVTLMAAVALGMVLIVVLWVSLASETQTFVYRAF